MTRASGRRRVVIGSVCLVAALTAGIGAWAVLEAPVSSSAAASDESSSPRSTTPVTKQDLTDSKILAGTLGYGAASGIPGAASGTLTWLPRPGQVIRRDEPLYAVDERAVRAMHGTVPMWRSLAGGRRGSDVRQLNENLAALGYDVSVDDVFGPRTRAAVLRWQADRGLERSGVLTADDIAFVDGDVRVQAVAGSLGQPAGGDVLTVTSTRRVVSASVPQRDAERLAVGTRVTIRINGSADTFDGEVADSAPGESRDGAQVVDVTIAFDPGDRELPEAASAQIDALGRSEHGVLTVPIAALVAGSHGAYAVDVVQDDGTTKRVRVRAGFVAEGRIAITGSVRAGDRVVVPS